MRLWARRTLFATIAVVGIPLVIPPGAHAGGQYIPGTGVISASRAGAAVASADDGEALAVNPAGLAKTNGTTITVAAAMIHYAMEFTRRGTYDQIATDDLPYEGAPYPTVRNDAKPPRGIGSFQPVPLVAVVTDLGGAVPTLRLAAGLWAPHAYPFRDMCTELPTGCEHYQFNGDFSVPPPPNRYDMMMQTASLLLPTLAASYRVLPELDVGGRFSLGFAKLESMTVAWGNFNNYEEYVKQDGLGHVEATDSFIPVWALGVTARPTPWLEFGAAYNSQLDIHAKGEARSEDGVLVGFQGEPVVVRPPPDSRARCAPGGTTEVQKACVEISTPQSAVIGARYKVLDPDGVMRGDVELDVGWENWSADRVTNFRIVTDADVYLVDASGNESYALSVKDAVSRHGFQDTYSFRLGGSFLLPVGASTLIFRGGVARDTAAAKRGWLRIDTDGAARTTTTLGLGYRATRWEVNVGGGLVLEGSPSNPGDCNPTVAMLGCDGSGEETPVGQRDGLDPINPAIGPTEQTQSPVTQGDYKSHYVMFMLGASMWF